MNMRFSRPALALIAALASALTATAARASEETADEIIRQGATREEVRAELGEPNSFIGSNAYEIYYYDRGEIIFRDGRLSSHSIVSEEEAEERRERKARISAELRQAREERRAERRAEGLEVKEEHVNDPAFNDLPPRARLAFWETFQRRYPEVDVELHVAVTREEVREEVRDYQTEMQRERQCAEIQDRRTQLRYYRESPVYFQRPYPVIIRHHGARYPGSDVRIRRGAKTDRRVFGHDGRFGRRDTAERIIRHKRHHRATASPEPPFSVSRDRDPNPGVLIDWGK